MWRCHFDFGLAKKWAVDGPLNLPCHPLLLSAFLYHSSSSTTMSNICTKSELACLPFCNAVVSIAHLQQEEGESKRGEKAREGRGKQRERGGSGKGAANAAYHWRKSAARGSLTVNIAGPLPLLYPSPLPLLSPTLRHCQLALFALEFPWLAALPDNAQSALKIRVARQKKLFSQRKRQKERESEREKDLPK